MPLSTSGAISMYTVCASMGTDNKRDAAGCIYIVVPTLTNTSAVWVTLIGKSILGTATFIKN